MSIVWVVENPKNQQSTFALDLAANFATRLFASWRTLERFARMQSNPRPSILLINPHELDFSLHAAERFVGKFLPQTKLFICDAACGELINSFGIVKRIRSLVESKNENTSGPEMTLFRSLKIDWDQAMVQMIDDPRHHSYLPKKEALILKVLIQKNGAVLSRDEIRKRVWNNLVVSERTIDSHVSRLRRRLQDFEISIESIYGEGYALV